MTPSYTWSAFAIVIISSLLLAGYYYVDTTESTKIYLEQNDTFMYTVLQGSYIVIVFAFLFNARYLIVNAARALWRRLSRSE